MTDISLAIVNLPEREQRLILRSACHVADESRLPEAMRFCNHVTDLDAARLLHAIERGALYVPSSTHDGWASLAPTRGFPHLTRVAWECLRLGLVERFTRETFPDIWLTWLVAAPVHSTRTHPACVAYRAGRRLRLSDDPALIDCQACLSLTDE